MMGECRYDLVPASDASVRDTDQNTVPVYVDFQNTAQTKSTIQTQHLTSPPQAALKRNVSTSAKPTVAILHFAHHNAVINTELMSDELMKGDILHVV